jgi:hypothetical protein
MIDREQCDGLRPTCSTCTQYEMSNCRYEVEEGQRRSSALKRQLRDLKVIIRELVLATDSHTMYIALQLDVSQFRNLGEIALAIREVASTESSPTSTGSSKT